jgi:predicted metal-dependent peptidase
MIIKNIHEKLLNSVQTMLIDTKINLPFYGEFNLHISFHEQDSIGTCAVNATSKGFNFYYSPKFLENMSQKEVNFIDIHEIFHLLFDHPKRTVTGQYNHKLSNIAQDMIINHIIWEDISHSFVEIPKSKDGKNMALFVPKEYKGKLIFEELYEWLKEEKDKWEKEQKQNKDDSGSNGADKKQDGGDQGQDGEGENNGGKDSTGKPSYGPYGKNPSKDGETLDTWSKEQIFKDLENGEGEYLDKHIGDEIPEEMREGMVKDIMERLAARGLSAGNVEQTLNKLRKKRKDYLREIKRAVSNMIFGTIKQKTIIKPSRRGIFGIKGNRKVKTCINVILDTSGSMGNTFEKVLSYIYRSDISVNMIQGDTEVKWVDKFMDKKKIERMKISGLGGTILTPSVEYVVENFNEFNTCILTDGYCDSLDLSKLKGRVLIISIGVKVPITKSNGKVKQICVDLID